MTAPDSRDSVVEQLRALLTLAEEATPGPWQSKNAHEWDEVVGNIDGPDAGQFHYTHVCSVDMRDLRTAEQITNAEIISGAVNFIRTHGPEVLQALARGPQQAGGEVGEVLPKAWWVDRLKQQEALTDAAIARAETAEAEMAEVWADARTLAASVHGAFGALKSDPPEPILKLANRYFLMKRRGRRSAALNGGQDDNA